MPMGHDAVNYLDVNQDDVKDEDPENTLPMMGGQGQFGPTGMGGMFTVFMVRDN